MLHQIKEYLRWLPQTYHLHGIHSPFIFDLHRNCVLDSRKYDGYAGLLRFRESVKNSTATLTIQDHGAGSRTFTSDSRKVRDIIKASGSTPKRCRLLYRLCKHLKITTALELGTSLGLATHAMATARPEAEIHSVEGSQAVYGFAKSGLEKEGLENIHLYNDTFSDFLHKRLDNTDKFDLIFIDGHHDGQSTIDFFYRLLEHAHGKTLFIFDDIHWSADMTRAWKTIIHCPQVTASINTFSWGLAFIRPEQKNQQFYIRVPAHY